VFLYIPYKFPVIVLYAPVTLMMSILLILYHALSSYVPPLVTLINFIASMFASLNVLYCLLLKQNVCIYPCFTLIIRMIRSVIIPVYEQYITFISAPVYTAFLIISIITTAQENVCFIITYVPLLATM